MRCGGLRAGGTVCGGGGGGNAEGFSPILVPRRCYSGVLRSTTETQMQYVPEQSAHLGVGELATAVCIVSIEGLLHCEPPVALGGPDVPGERAATV